MSQGKIELTENALRVLKRRYLAKDKNGEVIEEPEGMFERVARAVAGAEKNWGGKDAEKEWYEKFYGMMASLKFLPNSPTLMNAGRELGQLSACFVLPVMDSMESIFDSLKSAAMIHKSGGGTGFSFSRLRPKNDVVKTTGGIASGPVSFMKVYNGSTEVIKQGGTRRGANMGILRVDHPDIRAFITSKLESGELENFNISVAITDEFMSALEEDRESPLINPRNGEEVGKQSAREIFDLIADTAHRSGEPGVVFIDKIDEANPTPELGKIESTNPCGEQPLLPYESCNLGSINLAKFVKDGGIDMKGLREITEKAVRFLDDVIEINKYPLEEIERMTKENRKIGLGVMGFADLLMSLDVPYDGDEALRMGEKIMSIIAEEAKKASQRLAEERGPFSNFERSTHKDEKPIRNATLTTIAPTGSISIIAGCSSGIEPLFALVFKRKILDGEEFLEGNSIFEKRARGEKFYSEQLMKRVANTGSIKNMEELSDDVRRVFVTALDISPEWHIKMQAAFQKYVDNAVSKTVNFPNDATVGDVKKVYMQAYKLECKGVTIYRYGSRAAQVLYVGEEKGRKEIKPRPRPITTVGTTVKIRTGCGNLYVTINEDNEGLFEIFSQLGKAGGCADSQTEAISRMTSLALRCGIEAGFIIRQLKSIRCPNPVMTPEGMVLSCPDAIAKALERYLRDREEGGAIKITPTLDEFAEEDVRGMVEVCPECGDALFPEGGCLACPSCGYTKCG